LTGSARFASNARVRVRARVKGTVQGVGFRPFAYRLAQDEGLTGYVLNDEHGVLLEVEGVTDVVARFLTRLEHEAPPLAEVRSVVTESVPVAGERDFRILASGRGALPDAPVTADAASCQECLAELFDPADRRYRYPFTNCTNCGPRFTIVTGVPYDRPATTMAGFQMCEDCRREYDDPSDRRFHAQPNACPRCGPRAWLVGLDGKMIRVPGALDAVDGAARRLADGLIVAIKGVGGFHLACDAANQEAVATLRGRKHREEKPFALMVASIDAALRLVELGEEERLALESPQRPIVLAPRRARAGARVAAAIAPGAPELGVMLPYTPLHHLLMADWTAAVAAGAAGGAGALVMTSGNRSDEPIAFEDADALERLAPIADLFLLHDRPIHARTDDSVLRVVRVARTGTAARAPMLLRRSRGYVPRDLGLPLAAPRPILACGAEQKNTFCLAKADRAWVSHHIGDLEHLAALQAFQDGVSHFERLFAVRSAVVAHDMHPGYLSTAYALERVDVELLGVQHHHAHLAACLAEHGAQAQAVGAIFDGTGYGLDGTVWGGELLVGDLRGFERVGALRPVRLPGGAAAIREPWRMAFAWLTEALGSLPPLPGRLRGVVDEGSWAAMAGVMEAPTLSPVTTSMGRLFDAVAALCGLAPQTSYEGQAAVELEAAATRSADRRSYKFDLASDGPMLMLDPREAVRCVFQDLDSGLAVPAVAARFHAGVAEATARACLAVAEARGLDLAVLSGGVFQNRRLLESVAEALDRAGLRVLTPRALPPNDGGISFGQAAVAAARMARSV
jgi:hydrogenase maturation protein HypF